MIMKSDCFSSFLFVLFKQSRDRQKSAIGDKATSFLKIAHDSSVDWSYCMFEETVCQLDYILFPLLSQISYFGSHFHNVETLGLHTFAQAINHYDTYTVGSY